MQCRGLHFIMQKEGDALPPPPSGTPPESRRRVKKVWNIPLLVSGGVRGGLIPFFYTMQCRGLHFIMQKEGG